jgi:hypothetical protein
LSATLQSERIDEQNKRLRIDLDLGENEDVELELFVEDWLRKLALLGKS